MLAHDNKPDLVASALLTRQQVAQVLGMKVCTLKKWARQGVGPKPLHIGSRAVRYQQESLMEFIVRAGEANNE